MLVDGNSPPAELSASYCDSLRTNRRGISAKNGEGDMGCFCSRRALVSSTI